MITRLRAGDGAPATRSGAPFSVSWPGPARRAPYPVSAVLIGHQELSNGLEPDARTVPTPGAGSVRSTGPKGAGEVPGCSTVGSGTAAGPDRDQPRFSASHVASESCAPARTALQQWMTHAATPSGVPLKY